MNKNDLTIFQNINQRIVDGLQSYPTDVTELAIKAVQLSEKMPMNDVLEALRGQVRTIVRKHGGQP